MRLVFTLLFLNGVFIVFIIWLIICAVLIIIWVIGPNRLPKEEVMEFERIGLRQEYKELKDAPVCTFYGTTLYNPRILFITGIDEDKVVFKTSIGATFPPGSLYDIRKFNYGAYRRWLQKQSKTQDQNTGSNGI